mmetsp:Transcript_12296/g.19477  ORF Transcript_12296/g.19477 Transcript_12296/m.19477 type:complete len:208 (+) Transcript_12296:398-1021(+)
MTTIKATIEKKGPPSGISLQFFLVFIGRNYFTLCDTLLSHHLLFNFCHNPILLLVSFAPHSLDHIVQITSLGLHDLNDLLSLSIDRCQYGIYLFRRVFLVEAGNYCLIFAVHMGCVCIFTARAFNSRSKIGIVGKFIIVFFRVPFVLSSIILTVVNFMYLSILSTRVSCASVILLLFQFHNSFKQIFINYLFKHEPFSIVYKLAYPI